MSIYVAAGDFAEAQCDGSNIGTHGIGVNGYASSPYVVAAQECGADLVVLGAYGRSHVHEILFGSCTQAVIRSAERSVFVMH